MKTGEAENTGSTELSPRESLKSTCVKQLAIMRSHYPDRASALEYKDAAASRFSHSDVVFDLFIETCFFFHLITLLSNFSIFFSFLGITGPK